ncbi:hypothetical protein [Niveibacterium sp.]|uniref:hypothetical protein n=1 Tax=Niveibacterium sp. TaxID=2017444 RepID=UPI0035B11B3A
MKISSYGFLALLPLFLTGCLVPEKFSAKVEIQPDGGYAYSYKGTAVHALAAAELKQTGTISPRDDAGLKAEADKMAKGQDVRRAVYLGKGRYDLDVQGTKTRGQPVKLLQVLSVSTDKDGLITISSPELKDKERKQLEQLQIVIDGTLEVKVPKNAEVVSSNATSTPTMGLGGYAWKIGKVDQRPVMKVRLK